MRQIPKTIPIGPHVFEVTIHEDLVETSAAVGTMDIGNQEIRLQSINKDHNKASQMQALYHEILHAILEIHGEVDLSANEERVEGLSQLLYQAMKGKRGKAETIKSIEKEEDNG